MESFRDYDAEAFADVHHPDSTSVFAVGEVAIGRDAIMEALAGYFEAQTSTWSWTEITRSVQGCRTGVIVYRTLIERPGFSPARHQHRHLHLRARAVPGHLRPGHRGRRPDGVGEDGE